jgi:hypothetical protein
MVFVVYLGERLDSQQIHAKEVSPIEMREQYIMVTVLSTGPTHSIPPVCLCEVFIEGCKRVNARYTVIDWRAGAFAKVENSGRDVMRPVL